MNIKNALNTEITLVPTEFIEDAVITDKARLVGLKLLAFINSRNFNREKLAKACGFTVETLKKYLSELELRGWISLEKGKKDGYIFNAEPERVNDPEVPVEKIKLQTSQTILGDCIALYKDFYLKRVEVLPLIDNQGAASIKKMVEYFTGALGESKVITSFEAVFNNWDLLDEFLQDQLKPQQINSNLPNILNQIKKGYSKKKQASEPSGGKPTVNDKIDNF